MAEEQVPATPAQGTGEAPSVENRLVSFFAREEAKQEQDNAEGAQPETAQPAEGQAPTELTPDDIPDAEAPKPQPADEAFEFEASGQKLKLTRDETIKYAQQGFDYTQKTMALAEQARQLQERQQRVQAIEQANPHLQAAQAQVMALQAQMQPYQNVDWVRWATEDPLEYSKGRAQYDALAQAQQRAVGQYQHVANAIGQQQQILAQQYLGREGQQLVERIPEWKDPEKYKSGAQELKRYLVSEGATPAEVDALSSSIAVSVAWKAYQYDKLSKAKNEKVKQLRTAPPVTRPGATQTGTPEKDAQLVGRLRKTGDLKDAAALLLNRWK